jgi:hypothetical protein
VQRTTSLEPARQLIAEFFDGHIERAAQRAEQAEVLLQA